MDTEERRIIVEGAGDNRQWMWTVGVPSGNGVSVTTAFGCGRAWTRWGAIRAARRRLRQLDRQRRHRERRDVIDLPARNAESA